MRGQQPGDGQRIAIPDAGIGRLTSLAARLVGASGSAAILGGETRRRLAARGEPGPGEEGSPSWADEVSARVPDGGRPLVVPDVRKGPKGSSLPDGVAREAGAILGVPIVVDARRVGTMLVWHGQPRRWSAGDVAVVADLASVAGTNVALRLSVSTLSAHAYIDPLTALHNRRACMRRLDEECARAVRHGHELSLAVFDLDRFHAVNDRRGHVVGDATLIEFGRRLVALARTSDTVARIGGDEFAWILPETSGPAAWIACERARRAAARKPFRRAGALTASAGICSLADVRDAEDLYASADVALCQAKLRGRDVGVRYGRGSFAARGTSGASRHAGTTRRETPWAI